jgi:hypothetical protein
VTCTSTFYFLFLFFLTFLLFFSSEHVLRWVILMAIVYFQHVIDCNINNFLFSLVKSLPYFVTFMSFIVKPANYTTGHFFLIIFYSDGTGLGVAINPRPAGTDPPRPVYVIGYRVGFLKLKRVLNGSGFIKKPESDPNYLKKKKKKNPKNPKTRNPSLSSVETSPISISSCFPHRTISRTISRSRAGLDLLASHLGVEEEEQKLSR